jgi:hypothetical protein
MPNSRDFLNKLFSVTFKSTLNEIIDLSDGALFSNLHCNGSLYNTNSSFPGLLN